MTDSAATPVPCPVCLGGGEVIYDHSGNPYSPCRECNGTGRDNTDSPDCNCGWGGVHDPDNPRCRRNLTPDNTDSQVSS